VGDLKFRHVFLAGELAALPEGAKMCLSWRNTSSLASLQLGEVVLGIGNQLERRCPWAAAESQTCQRETNQSVQ
jgi:hypothetical protein